jgi:hypothetical protein
MRAGKVMDWLLEEDNPPVRYLTLRNLLKKPETDPEVVRAKSRLMSYKVTQGILKHADKFWGDDEKAYWKYTGKYWQLIFLGQFLADGKDPRIARGVSGILAKRDWVISSGAQCLTANILAALVRLGYGSHPVVAEEREALAQRIVKDGGIDCGAMGYSLLPRCYMAQPKLLLCFSQVPPQDRTAAMNSAIKMLADRMLEHEVFVYVPGTQKEWQKVLEQKPGRAELPAGQSVKQWISEQRNRLLAGRGLGKPKPKQGWLKFGFPLHYNSDILETMYALAELGTPMTAALAKPLQAIREKMTPDGKWIMENSLNGKMWVDIEEKGKPSKWLTYFARCVLGHFG